MTSVRSQENATTMRQMLEGICVNTIVLMRPMRLPSHAATGNENAASTFVQKKNALAAPSDKLKRSNSQSASSDWTVKPPANESRLNRAASLYTVLREGPSGAALAAACAALLCGSLAYSSAPISPSAP